MSWPSNGSATGRGPLEGTRVLDLSRILAGPYCSTLLGDLGADVIKVEHPGGDETRRWGPPFVDGTAAYFFTANRNRRAITLDLKDGDDRAVARQLAADADIVIENFLPEAAQRLGVDHLRLRAVHAALVHCTISGYGTSSRRAGWPALDFVIQAHAGIMGVTGTSPDSPTKAGAPVADMAAGLFATIGILASLQRARETGTGAHVEVALADACVCLLANQAMNCLLGGLDPRPAGNTHPNIAPYQTVTARDRPIALAATSDRQFRELCQVLGREALSRDPRFASNATRVAHRDELVAELDNALAEADAAEWVTRLNEAGVAAATINSPREVFADPDIQERMVSHVPDRGRDIAQLRAPIRIDGQPLEVRSAPPALGAHSEEIRAAVTGTEPLEVQR